MPGLHYVKIRSRILKFCRGGPGFRIASKEKMLPMKVDN
jgi:hypothetical protein